MMSKIALLCLTFASLSHGLEFEPAFPEYSARTFNFSTSNFNLTTGAISSVVLLGVVVVGAFLLGLAITPSLFGNRRNDYYHYQPERADYQQGYDYNAYNDYNYRSHGHDEGLVSRIFNFIKTAQELYASQ